MMTDTIVMQDASEIVTYDQMGIPLYIQRDKLSDYPDWKALCHWHEDMEFIRILEGQMNYHINGKRVLLKKDDCIMVNARQMHYGYSFNRKDCDFICILFHPQLFTGNKLLYQKYISPIMENQRMEYIYFDGFSREGKETAALLDQIYFSKEQANDAYEIEVIGFILTLWKRLYERCEVISPDTAGQTGSDLSAQKDMVSFIYQHYAEKLSLSDIAGAGSICRSKCCMIFKRYLQQSPIEFLNAYRLEVSRSLLKDPAASITQVALACGFNHLSYYSKLFLRSYGCTPREYRSLHSL
ncbi:AraC family transcriptional regulator [Lacrimispora saccharolytica]|uniref:Transcriptional regulator, AraC family n=1 Tax=Lacrimispora saccharolytica (strain ATCC 35040 / DSM 2544 / NRCC 2533 / WM1) TaxID=610130 RepID=D9R3Z2_LACSW|nr:AraC family transcriptional regulator [Lacrimispora saccharolytica]ADL03105.1 transcriptional regulator, AraC family [[Clostridium] saccharolyticum WM1]